MASKAGRQVVVIPPWPCHLDNRILTPGDHSTVSDAFAAWRTLAAGAGFEINTHDLCPPSRADILWFVDLPAQRRDFEAMMAAARPGTGMVLHQLESPLYARAAHRKENHQRFDRVLTYNPETAKVSTRYRLCRIPYAFKTPAVGPPFARRRLAVMVNTNRAAGWTERRGPGHGLAALPGIGQNLNGWRVPWKEWLYPCPGNLFAWRRRLARAAESLPGAMLDVYGQNWRGERIHWWRHPRPRPYRGALQAPHGTAFPDLTHGHSAKLGLLPGYRFSIASENYLGQCGYISEKLLDALQADTVPVYLGDKHIKDLLPAEAFVDAREFRSPLQLLMHLARMPEEEWNRRRATGQAWLHSPGAQSFSTESFVNTTMQVLHEVSRQCP